MNLRETEIKKCRKPHRCVWCGEVIEVGTPSVSKAWIWEGDMQYGHFHPECNSALQRSEDTLDGWTEGEQRRGVAYNRYGDPITEQTTA